MIRMTPIIATLSVLVALAPASFVAAQQYPPVDGRQFPLNESSPPGCRLSGRPTSAATTACTLSACSGHLADGGTGDVCEDDGPPAHRAVRAAGRIACRPRVPSQGERPRRLSGDDFYPSIELIDRLHPPTGREEDFPIDFAFTIEEFDWAANGRLVTKVDALEQPERVPTLMLDGAGASRRSNRPAMFWPKPIHSGDPWRLFAWEVACQTLCAPIRSSSGRVVRSAWWSSRPNLPADRSRTPCSRSLIARPSASPVD